MAGWPQTDAGAEGADPAGIDRLGGAKPAGRRAHRLYGAAVRVPSRAHAQSVVQILG